MKIRELINRLEKLSNEGKNDNEEIITRDIDNNITSDIINVVSFMHDNGKHTFELITD